MFWKFKKKFQPIGIKYLLKIKTLKKKHITLLRKYFLANKYSFKVKAGPKKINK
tara:strand:- start:98 stop:259 length:162 start_codon:yes stop_codon:yes gene_type:complete